MRTHLALALGAAAFTMMLGGCVSKAQYDEALAANRRANLELQKTQEALRVMRDQNQEAESRLSAAAALADKMQKDIALLEKAKADLERQYNELSEKYRLALAGGNQPQPLPINVRVLPAGMDAALKAFAAANPDLVEYLPEYGMVKFKADLTFEPGSDYVQDAAQQALAKFAGILNSAEAASFNIYIAGHTDDMPIAKPETKKRHPDNWYLSAHRAVAVEQVLATAGIKPARLAAMGFGEYHPVAPNAAGHKGNKLNRRVEIWIVQKSLFQTASSTDAGAAAPAADDASAGS